MPPAAPVCAGCGSLAVSLLVLAAVVFVADPAASTMSGCWGYVNTAAEAAMVGALADWFAVTALFRHPLGLPIPHTAIIPKRKNEIGRNLQEFVTENFLTEEIARERLAAARVGERVGQWLGVPEHRRRVATEAVRVGRAGLGRLSDDEVRALVEDFLVPRLVQEPMAPIAGTLLEGIVDEQTHHGLVDLGLEQLRDWLADNPGTYAAVLGERAPWWSPPWVDDKVIGWTYQQVLAWLRDIQDDPRHPARQALDDLLKRLAADLQHDPEVMAQRRVAQGAPADPPAGARDRARAVAVVPHVAHRGDGRREPRTSTPAATSCSSTSAGTSSRTRSGAAGSRPGSARWCRSSSTPTAASWPRSSR